MKKILAIFAALALMATAGTAMAAGTANLSVSANITASCTVSAGSIAFGALNPLTAPLVEEDSTGVTVTCTNGTTYTLSTTANKGTAGNPGTLSNGTSTINYTISYTAAGLGTGNAEDVVITGTIPAGSYNTATPGSYTDTIQLSVSP